jgi:phage gp36-like protein
MYATADQMRTTYGEAALVQLADAADWDGALPRINKALSDATVRADGHVAKYYSRALIVSEIAYADLHRAPTEEVATRRKAAMRDLEGIAKGLIKLDDGVEELPSRDGQVIVPDTPRTFSRQTLSGF